MVYQIRSFARLCAAAATLASIALLHHGHVQMFIQDVYASLRRKLPAPLRKHEAVLKPSLVQVYFEDPSIHYEAWVQRKTRSIEIGLHFEGEREENARWAEMLSERAPEIARALGPSAELETWTRSWTRLHESRASASTWSAVRRVGTSPRRACAGGSLGRRAGQ